MRNNSKSLTHIVLLFMIWSFIIGGIVGYEVQTRAYINIYRHNLQTNYTHYRTMYKWLTVEIFTAVVRSCDRYKLPIPLVLAVIDAESGGKSNAVSAKGAIGLMQVMPFHSDNPKWLFNPTYNIDKGCSILAWCLKISGGDVVMALKNYNSGFKSNYYNKPYISDVLLNYIAKGQFKI